MKRILVIFIITFSFFELVFLFVPVCRGIFFFTFDQARDAIWVKNQIDGRQLSLLGPWASLQGTFFGPLWFWLLIIPHVISGGNPASYVLFNALIVFGTVFFLACILKKYSFSASFFVIVVSLITIGFHGLSGFAFPSHMMLFFTFLLIFSLVRLVVKFEIKYFLLSVFSISLMFHGEPPTAIFSLPTLILIVLASLIKNRKTDWKFMFEILILGAIVFIVPFVPQIIFDLRHDFLQLNSIISYFSGNNKSLGDILPFSQRLVNRPVIFFETFKKLSFYKYPVLSFFSLIVVFWIHLKKEKNLFFKLFFDISVLYLFILFVLFTIYPPQLKDFYLDGILIIFLVLCTNALRFFWKKQKIHKIGVTVFIIISFVLNREPLQEIKRLKNNYSDLKKNGSIYANQIDAIDWVYEKANGDAFKVYIYQPAVYDFAYQYIFLNYALKKYGYLPEDFSYLPDQPDYVPQKKEFLLKNQDRIKIKSKFLFLIIEDDTYSDRQKKWFNNFSKKKFKLLQEIGLPDKTRIEKRALF